MVQIARSEDNRGSPITSYSLFVDAGDDFSSDFSQVTSYTSNSLTHSVDVAQDQVETGKIYRFKTTATNDFGESDFSQEVIIGIG
jgi:hypothetical protein